MSRCARSILLRTPAHFARAYAAASWLALFAALVPLSARAAELELAFPLDCVPGESCWVAFYYDHDDSKGIADYMCEPHTRDNHRGIDFAIRDLKAMAEGVEVRVAAAGVVRAVRDGMDDVNVREIGPEAVEDVECGNGVLVQHGETWSTQYCHLRKGSVAVKPGDRVETGQTLGLVGMSGLAEFPHLHLTVRHKGKKVDPFAGIEQGEPCGLGADPLWSEAALAAVPYEPVALYNYGIIDRKPEAKDLRSGRYRVMELPADAPALVLWTEVMAVKAGDHLSLKLVGPKGGTVAQKDWVLEKTQPWRFQFVGAPLKGEAWPKGTFRGEIALTREGAAGPITVRREVSVEVR